MRKAWPRLGWFVAVGFVVALCCATEGPAQQRGFASLVHGSMTEGVSVPEGWENASNATVVRDTAEFKRGPDLTPIPRSEQSPTVEHIAPVAPDILAIRIQAGRVVPSKIIPYEKREGDEVLIKKKLPNGDIEEAVLKRDETEIAWVIGRDNDHLCTFEKTVGDRLQTDIADQVATYTITSDDDAAYADGRKPVKVARKSKPTNWDLPERMNPPMRHCLYLHLPAPLRAGATYKIAFGDLNTGKPVYRYKHDPDEVRSEAVHVSHIGFRPDDPGKRGYLSVWLGDGGAHSYGPGLRFHLVETGSGRRVHEGHVRLTFAATDKERMQRTGNHNYTDVYRMDFGDFTTPGVYRLVVDGIGGSHPFVVGDDVWRKAFVKSMRGFYHQRAGIELGPPYTDYKRPRNFHPEDGVRIHASTMRIGEGSLHDLVARATEETLNAWGGYHDAGDWDRRVQHLSCSRFHLELLELFPDYFENVTHNIPESGNDLPDLLDEALWNINLYRRLQLADGSVCGGIESAAHPRAGEPSWMESLTVAAFAPDVVSTYTYAAVAARAAHALENYGREQGDDLQQSALRAMAWAEQHQAESVSAGPKQRTKLRDLRNLAALELYRLTGRQKWHDIFKATTVFRKLSDNVYEMGGGSDAQGHAAFLYARLGDNMVDARLKENAKKAIIAVADSAVNYAKGNAFNVAHYNRYMPLILGFFSTPHVVEVAWAHYLTGDDVYLETMVRACNFGAGANPLNMTFTTGVGHDWPKNPLHLDSRRSGQPAPEGITLYGLNDFKWEKEYGGWLTWPFKWFFNRQCHPDGNTWPITESYFDVCMVPSMCEFTVHQNMGPNCFAWGYLAARQ